MVSRYKAPFSRSVELVSESIPDSVGQTQSISPRSSADVRQLATRRTGGGRTKEGRGKKNSQASQDAACRIALRGGGMVVRAVVCLKKGRSLVADDSLRLRLGLRAKATDQEGTMQWTGRPGCGDPWIGFELHATIQADGIRWGQNWGGPTACGFAADWTALTTPSPGSPIAGRFSSR